MQEEEKQSVWVQISIVVIWAGWIFLMVYLVSTKGCYKSEPGNSIMDNPRGE